MGLSKELSCELGVSPTAASNPMGVSNQRFEALFPHAGAVCWAVCFASLPFLPVYLCANMGPQVLLAVALPAPFILQLASSYSYAPLCVWPRCCESSLPQLPVSTPPTSLDECLFFFFLVVGLPYSLIFCEFWLFFVFKLLSFFDCARRHSVSTYVSILAGSQLEIFDPPWIPLHPRLCLHLHMHSPRCLSLCPNFLLLIRTPVVFY